jgi:flagellar biosynthesis anti-sigma factor FlgM
MNTMNPIQSSIAGSTSGSVQRADPGSRRVSVGSGASAGTSAPDTPTETVSISSSARLLNTAAASSAAGASTAQITQLRSAIASGQYHVDPQAIAKGLVRDSRALQQASAG